MIAQRNHERLKVIGVAAVFAAGLWCATASAETTNAAVAVSTNAPRATTTNAPAATTDDPDALWKEVLRASQPPPLPAAWGGKQPTEEQVAEFRLEKGRLAGEAADKAKDLFTRFPTHAKAAAARAKYQEMLKNAYRLGNDRSEELEKFEVEQLKDPNLSEDERYKLKLAAVERRQAAARGEGPEEYLAELEKSGRELIKEFPKYKNGYVYLLDAAKNADEIKARKLAREILAGSPAADTKAGAEGLLRKVDAVGKPLEIKFTAVDGREVDTTKMSGKVVLIDFWATWCGPCVAEIPHVKEAYEKLHDKGFEIVAVSFDQDKEKLKSFVAEKGMAWPQYFEDKGKANKFGDQYSINSIPTMWLMDKKGLLRDMNARGALTKKVEELLAE